MHGSLRVKCLLLMLTAKKSVLPNITFILNVLSENRLIFVRMGLFFRGKLMQIWKAPYMFMFI